MGGLSKQLLKEPVQRHSLRVRCYRDDGRHAGGSQTRCRSDISEFCNMKTCQHYICEVTTTLHTYNYLVPEGILCVLSSVIDLWGVSWTLVGSGCFTSWQHLQSYLTLCYPTERPSHQHHDLTLFRHKANQSLPYHNKAERLARKQQVSIFKSLV